MDKWFEFPQESPKGSGKRMAALETTWLLNMSQPEQADAQSF
ncbi:MAG: hypothetical protein PUC47_09930 [Oscillospiraceae bacterium]|nr:hypothetical protein [Oscillospiraceae bacterium]